ncbi:alpha/beta hydrolase [Nocardioidaceae bacterium]|nr:alpha/beta hydrolase [Nocardioidaceae bacterium]
MTASVVEAPGPWEHRYVSANGARFHVVVCEPAASPVRGTVLLLHGFPQLWWTWRAQLVGLADAGWRAVAMDLRGYGGSDKTPEGYDPGTLAADVAGVIGSLGLGRAVVVGHGWGAYVAWTAAVAHPDRVAAVGSVAATHPQSMLRSLWRHRPLALRHVVRMQLPWLPERRIRTEGYLRRHLGAWSSPTNDFPDAQTVSAYASSLALWPAPHCALEYHRWLGRSRFRADGRAYRRLMSTPVSQPALVLLGADDPALGPLTSDRTPRFVDGPVRRVALEQAGHFLPEERPDAVTAQLVDWLGQLELP